MADEGWVQQESRIAKRVGGAIVWVTGPLWRLPDRVPPRFVFPVLFVYFSAILTGVAIASHEWGLLLVVAYLLVPANIWLQIVWSWCDRKYPMPEVNDV